MEIACKRIFVRGNGGLHRGMIECDLIESNHVVPHYVGHCSELFNGNVAGNKKHIHTLIYKPIGFVGMDLPGHFEEERAQIESLGSVDGFMPDVIVDQEFFGSVG
jgi:hypothetical protein